MKLHLMISLCIFTLLADVQAARAEKILCSTRIMPDIEYDLGKFSVARSKSNFVKTPLTLDAYIPFACRSAPKKYLPPPILIVTGKGFTSGSSKETDIVRMARELSKNGFAAFVVNYRLGKLKTANMPVLESTVTLPTSKEFRGKIDDIYLDQIEDVLRIGKRSWSDSTYMERITPPLIAVEDLIKARKYIETNHRFFRINTERWGIVGASAGAIAALGATYGSDDIGLLPQKYTSIVSLWGALTLPGKIEREDGANLLIIHGTKDRTIPYQLSTLLLEAAEEGDVSVRRISVDGADHDFNLRGIDLWERTAPGTTQYLIDTMIELFHQTLRT